MNESKEVGKYSDYRILAKYEQFFEFEIRATSPENACKRLNARLKRDASTVGPAIGPEDTKPGGYSWSPPEECAYAVSGGTLPYDPSGESITIWNGKEFMQAKFPKSI